MIFLIAAEVNRLVLFLEGDSLIAVLEPEVGYEGEVADVYDLVVVDIGEEGRRGLKPFLGEDGEIGGIYGAYCVEVYGVARVLRGRDSDLRCA